MTQETNSPLARLQAPLGADEACELRAGQRVLISGTVFTARDAAHARLIAMVESGEPLPVDLDGAIIYAPALHAMGVRATIGKGPRSDELQQALVEHGAVYLAAVGGAGALLGETISECEVVAFPELGPEAIRKLTVEDFPAIVAYDSVGDSAFA